jgi:hypothetical protein
MKVLNSNQTKLFVIILLMIAGFITIKAQDKKEDPLKTKLEQIKGTIEKIIVKVDGKEIVFDSKESEKLAERFKGKRIEKRIRISDDDDCMMNFVKDGNDKEDEGRKKIKVEVTDGKKKITVTTTKDGKEETKVLEGEDAEKFLNDEKNSNRIEIMTDDEDMPRPPHRMRIEMEDEGGCCCCCCRHRMPPPPMHGKKIMMKMKMKNMDKDCKSMGKECKGMNKDEDKEKDAK